MADEPNKPMTGPEIEAYLEAHTRPRRFGLHYAALIDVVDEELQAQLALDVLGDAVVSDAQRRTLAEMVADEVDWRFRLEPRLPPGEDDLVNDARAGSTMTIEDFLRRLDASRTSYRLDRVRDALMVVVFVPGERWEVEFFPDGSIEVERFRSNGEIGSELTLEELWPLTE